LIFSNVTVNSTRARSNLPKTYRRIKSANSCCHATGRAIAAPSSNFYGLRSNLSLSSKQVHDKSYVHRRELAYYVTSVIGIISGRLFRSRDDNTRDDGDGLAIIIQSELPSSQRRLASSTERRLNFERPARLSTPKSPNDLASVDDVARNASRARACRSRQCCCAKAGPSDSIYHFLSLRDPENRLSPRRQYLFSFKL